MFVIYPQGGSPAANPRFPHVSPPASPRTDHFSSGRTRRAKLGRGSHQPSRNASSRKVVPVGVRGLGDVRRTIVADGGGRAR